MKHWYIWTGDSGLFALSHNLKLFRQHVRWERKKENVKEENDYES